MAEQESRILDKTQLEDLARQARNKQAGLTAGMSRLSNEAYTERSLVVEPNLNVLDIAAETWKRLSEVPSLREEVLRRSLQKVEEAFREAQVEREALLVALGEKDPEISLPDGTTAKFEAAEIPILSGGEKLVAGKWGFEVAYPTDIQPEMWREWHRSHPNR